MKASTLEYAQLTPENTSKRTLLNTAKGGFGSTYSLIHKTEGYECAGSCARHTSELWGSVWERPSGTNGGTWFKTEAEATKEFLARTTPVIEISA